jgi:Cys-tRNA(Pro)/Cys-tRNA(Cys) deacylase
MGDRRLFPLFLQGDKMTPAVVLIQRRKVAHRIHSYDHDPAHEGYGLEAADKLRVPVERVFKTLLTIDGAGGCVVALVPVSGSLDMKKLAQAHGVKKLGMADPKSAERLTGYQVGGISPLGQKRLLPTVVDSSSRHFQTIFVSGGRRGLEIELAPDDLLSLLKGRYGDIARY